MTGLSRSFFYNNTRVRAEIEGAKKKQKGMDFNRPKRLVFDRAMNEEINRLKRKIEEKDKIILDLVSEMTRLRKMLDNEYSTDDNS